MDLHLKISRIICITLLFSVGFSQQVIAVHDIVGPGLTETQKKKVFNKLETELVNLETYEVISRSNVDKILKEQKFQMSGIIDEKYLIDIGEMLGAELIVLGNVGKVGNIYTVSARIVNSKTAEILRSANYDTGTSISNLLTIGMANIAHKLIGVSDSTVKKELDNKQKVNSQRNQTENIIENKNIIILNVKKKLSMDGSNKVYVTYRQRISYKPSEIMIDWLDTDGIPYDGDKKYTKSKVRKDEIRSLSFYVPDEAFDYRVWLKK